MTAARRLPAWAVLSILVLTGAFAAEPGGETPATPGPAPTLELELHSEFSHILVRRLGSHRSLWFRHDSGAELLQTEIDLESPHELLSPYKHAMFGTYLFRPEQKRLLIVGLGGGAMIHFLEHRLPRTRIDAVEIDPAVVSIADEYFGTRSGGRTRIITADGFDYILNKKKRYDAIYMDAYLEPSVDTDSAGASLRSRTLEFLRTIRGRLLPGGVLSVNLNFNDRLVDDIRNFRAVFPQVYLFRVPNTNTLILIATLDEERREAAELVRRARKQQRRFGGALDLESVVAQLVP